jgi:hypothetical protein
MEKAYQEAKRRFPDWAGGADFKAEFEEAVNKDPLTRFLSDNYGLIVISELILNPQFQETILKMKWWVMDFAVAGISLVTCDRPYTIFRSITHPRGLIRSRQALRSMFRPTRRRRGSSRTRTRNGSRRK